MSNSPHFTLPTGRRADAETNLPQQSPPAALPYTEQGDEAEEAGELIPKPAAGYINTDPKGMYQCDTCTMFIRGKERCTAHDADQVIRAHGSCIHWHGGQNAPDDSKPMGGWTPLDSAYEENEQGFSCARCEYFQPDAFDCEIVDKDSEGLDEGKILAKSCCNLWENYNEEEESEVESELEGVEDYGI